MTEFIRHPLYRCGATYTSPPPAVQSLAARAVLSRVQPVPCDWFRALPANGDGLGNVVTSTWRGASDCWPVARRVIIALRRANAAGDSTWPTMQDCLADYTALTGYDQTTGAHDDGTETAAGMADWVTRGVRINDQTLDLVHWSTVDPTDDPELAIALQCAGPLMATWRLVVALQDPGAWSEAPGTGPDWTTLWASHETVWGASDGGAEFMTRTWGMDINVHPEIRRRFCIACDVPLNLSPGAWLEVDGLTPLRLDRDALANDMEAIA